MEKIEPLLSISNSMGRLKVEIDMKKHFGNYKRIGKYNHILNYFPLAQNES